MIEGGGSEKERRRAYARSLGRRERKAKHKGTLHIKSERNGRVESNRGMI